MAGVLCVFSSVRLRVDYIQYRLGSAYTALSQQYLEILTKPECKCGYSAIIKRLTWLELHVESAVVTSLLKCRVNL